MAGHFMITSQSNLRERLRDLPTGYLLDLLADHDGIEESALRDVLRERGLETEEIARQVHRRRHSRLPRGHILWQASRKFILACTVLVGAFNLAGYYRLLNGDSPIKSLLLGLSLGGIAFGFFLGYKLSTHVYQGAPHQLYCGFPLTAGTVDLETGQETVKDKLPLIFSMAVNATVGLNLVLFPLLLIHHLLN